MKRLASWRKGVALVISVALVLTGCVPVSADSGAGDTTLTEETGKPVGDTVEVRDFLETLSGPEDARYQAYLEDVVYAALVEDLADQGYYVERVDAAYVSEEYLEEVAYNTQANIYFGYTLSELDEQFEGTKYIFNVSDEGETVVQEFESHVDAYGQVVENLAVGGGVILFCITVSVATGGIAPAVSMIFACAAGGAARGAVIGGTISGITAGVVTGIETGDFDEAIEAAAFAGSEGFKWGAVGGALAEGIAEGAGLRGAARNGLSMNEAAQIQRDSGMPLDVIGQLNSMDQYEILRDGGVTASSVPIAGRTALIRPIDLNQVDELGRTNLERMRLGLAALDPDGLPYELHHVGQAADGTLAILTRQEHRSRGNYRIWHLLNESDVSHGSEWTTLRKNFWKAMADLAGGGSV